MGNKIENTKLVITLHHENPVDLINLTISLNSFGQIFTKFNDDKEIRLLIKEINKCCIEFELVVNFATATYLPLLIGVNNITQYYNFIKLLILICSNGSSDEISSLTKDFLLPTPCISIFRLFKKFINIACNSNDKVEINTKDQQGNNYFGCSFYGSNVPIMNDYISKIDKNSKKDEPRTKMLFRWDQTNHNKLKEWNKGIIENISSESLKIIFLNENIKNEMTSVLDWQNQLYVIDVIVQYVNDNPKMYKIIKHYPEDMFSRNE